jgi:hypothetical protein
MLHRLFARQGIMTMMRKGLATKERRKKAVRGDWTLKTLAAHEGRLAELGKRMEEERADKTA